jgi:hypothetical protein
LEALNIMQISRLCAIVACAVLLSGAGAGGNSPAAQSASDDLTSGLLADYKWRSIGPGSAGGRITDVEALESDFTYVIVASASGGVWKSVNAGTTWMPIFDNYPSASIGDIKIFQGDRNLIWVGTGEANNRNSVAWGDGIYKSIDGGETFTNVGLRNTFQIARVVTHPSNRDIVYVAAVGQLWGQSGDRGLFKTIDGGQTWQKLTGGLPADPDTGATEIVMDPTNPEVLYTAFYKRIRLPWRFESGSTTGGMFKSTDGGRTWKPLTRGLPAGWKGRIGIDVYKKNPQIVMAIVEAEQTGDLSTPDSGVYRSEDGGDTWKYLNTYNNRPFYYSQIRMNPADDQRVYVLTANFMWSFDGGTTLVSPGAPFGSAYDHHAMWFDPANTNRFYLGKDKGLTLTHDHGGSFLFYDNLPVSQAYHVAVDMRDPYAVYQGLQDNGTWSTMSFTRDALGIRNDVTWKLHYDDGMYLAIDRNDWRTVYSEGTNASFRLVDPVGRSDTSRRVSPASIVNWADVATPVTPGGLPAFRTNWTAPFILSPHDQRTIYYGINHLLKSTNGGVTWTAISKDLSTGDPQNTRITNSQVGGEAGAAEQHGTIYSISESPLVAGTIWVGTDDGNLWLTRDDGATWTQVDASIPDVPNGLQVSRVLASVVDANTAYVAFDGHRSDNRAPWLFRTTDGGGTWQNVSAGLLAESPIYVVEEDSRNPDLLLVGTEHGVQISLDRGRSWRPMMNGLPTVAVYDIDIHPRDRDVIIGTHGRGAYILDDITALEAWRPALAAQPAHLFSQRMGTLWADGGRKAQLGENTYAGENPPSVLPVPYRQRDRARLVNTPLITFYLGRGAAGTASLEITNPDGVASTMSIPAKAGITRYAWDMRDQGAAPTGPGAARGRGAGAGRGGRAGGRGGGNAGRANAAAPPRSGAGVYALKLTIGGATATGTLALRDDPILTRR